MMGERHTLKKLVVTGLGLMVTAFTLASCSKPTLPHLKPLPAETRALLAKKGMRDDSPIYVRIFKSESELEVWKVKDDGKFHHFKTYPICNWSGKLGPKLKTGDRQSPEGFYRVSQGQMNPNSKFHLAFNLGYPNAFDRSHGRTGAHLMVHGDCKSKGCYAMTDALVEEIYILARDAFRGGQKNFSVHAFPFRMTSENMKKHRRNKWHPFWRQLKLGYDHFEKYQTEPKVDVCSRRYLVNASFIDKANRIDPQAPCPAYQSIEPDMLLRGPRFEVASSKFKGAKPVMSPAKNVHTGNIAEKPSTTTGNDSILLSDSPLLGLTSAPSSFRERAISHSIRLGQ